MAYKLPEITPEERLRIVQHRLYETVKNCAERIGIPASTIYKWLERGLIAEMRVGGRRFVLTENVDAYLASQIRLPDSGSIAGHLRGSQRVDALRVRMEAEARNKSIQQAAA